MNIVVFIKQVADNTKLKLSESGPILEGVPMMMNPYDEYALETAIRIKEAAGGDSKLTVISLGNAKEIVKKAIAAGADEGFILVDSAFDKGDSTSNAYVLSQSVQKLVPNPDLLVFGQMSLDDAASQTGPKVAEFLGLPSLTYGKNAELSGQAIKFTRETERGTETWEANLPAVICMQKCEYELRSSNIKGVMKANKTDIPAKSAADLGLDAAKAGQAGATTQTVKMWQRPAKTGGKVVEGADAKGAVVQLIDYLKESKVL